MDMLEENLKVINTRLLLSELYKTEDTVGFCSKLKTLKFISALTRCVAVVSDESCNKKNFHLIFSLFRGNHAPLVIYCAWVLSPPQSASPSPATRCLLANRYRLAQPITLQCFHKNTTWLLLNRFTNHLQQTPNSSSVQWQQYIHLRVMRRCTFYLTADIQHILHGPVPTHCLFITFVV